MGQTDHTQQSAGDSELTTVRECLPVRKALPLIDGTYFYLTRIIFAFSFVLTIHAY